MLITYQLTYPESCDFGKEFWGSFRSSSKKGIGKYHRKCMMAWLLGLPQYHMVLLLLPKNQSSTCHTGRALRYTKGPDLFFVPASAQLQKKNGWLEDVFFLFFGPCLSFQWRTVKIQGCSYHYYVFFWVSFLEVKAILKMTSCHSVLNFRAFLRHSTWPNFDWNIFETTLKPPGFFTTPNHP